MRRPSSLLPLMFSFLCTAACADTATAPEGENSVVTVEDEANASSETDEEEDRTPTTREGSPCDSEGERDCDLDDAIVCQGGIWTFLESCEGEWTCSMTTGTCEEKICERGERRCIDRETIEFCKPDQTGWLEPTSLPRYPDLYRWGVCWGTVLSRRNVLGRPFNLDAGALGHPAAQHQQRDQRQRYDSLRSLGLSVRCEPRRWSDWSA